MEYQQELDKLEKEQRLLNGTYVPTGANDEYDNCYYSIQKRMKEDPDWRKEKEENGFELEDFEPTLEEFIKSIKYKPRNE